MRSHLTRRVFQQILRNQPLVHSRHTCQNTSYNDRHMDASGLGPRVSRRTFLWFGSKKPTRRPKDPDIDPGVVELKEVSDFLNNDERPPPRERVSSALNDFFAFKLKKGQNIVDIQMHYALVAFRHLVETTEDRKELGMTFEQLWAALKALSVADKGVPPETTVALADLIYTQLENIQPESEDPELKQRSEFNSDRSPLYTYMMILSRCGGGLKMKALLEESLRKAHSRPLPPSYWYLALKAFVRAGQQDELSGMLALMNSNEVRLDRKGHEVLLTEYAQCGPYEAFQKCYHIITQNFGSLSPEIQPKVVEMCIQHRDLDLGQSVVNEILSDKPSKRAWDVVFKWAAFKGQSVEDIDRMMDVMASSDGSKQPNTRTINGLVEVAYAMSSPALVDGFMALAAKRTIPLDGKTYMLQTTHCLNTGDIPGAENSFMQARQHELPDGEEVAVINELIQSLCKSAAPKHEAILDYVHELIERKARFAPDTVAVLAKYHLQRNELLDTVDLLQTHAHHFGLQQRSSIRAMLVELIKDRRSSDERAWDAYSILREIFPESDVNTRTMMMVEFFLRGRSNMGMYVFGHMRQADDIAYRPTSETYTKCLEGLAYAPNNESLELVHNMLKLDSKVELNTRVRNGLMLAYLACDMPRRSLEFWDDIVYSKEGPSYNSICIAFRACEIEAFGVERANNIWQKLERYGVETTPQIYAAYVGAVAGGGMVDQAIEAVQNMDRAIQQAPDALTIGSLHNATIDDDKRKQADEWAKTTYPQVWEELERLGQTEEGRFKINRRLSA